MDLIISHTNSLRDAVRIELGEKSKTEHIQKLRRQRDASKKQETQRVGQG